MGYCVRTLYVSLVSTITLYGGWLVMKGPFFARAVPDTATLVGGAMACVVGLVVLTFGLCDESGQSGAGPPDLDDGALRTYK